MKSGISKMIKHPGRLTDAAHRAGESINEYASQHEHDPQGTIGDAARMYNHMLKPAASKARKGTSEGKGHFSGH